MDIKCHNSENLIELRENKIGHNILDNGNIFT